MVREWLAGSSVRPLVMRALERANPGDIRVWHPYYPRKVLLHSFHHKGYWFYGKGYDSETAQYYARVIQPADTVVEVGAHIGYQTLHFAALVPQGRVLAFEPGSNNLPYLLHNCAGVANVEPRREAVGATSRRDLLFEDNLTGQNNSLVSFGAGQAAQNAKSSNFTKLAIVPTQVDVVTLDEATEGQPVQFVKVKITGGEADVVAGALGLLTRSRPNLMVKVSEPGRDYIWQTLVQELGYEALAPNRSPIADGPSEVTGNTFFLHPAGPVR